MAELEGRNVKIAREMVETLRYISARTNIKMSDLASVFIFNGIEEHFPKMAEEYLAVRPDLRLEEQLVERGFLNETGQPASDRLECQGPIELK
jgi:hypothetical protein